MRSPPPRPASSPTVAPTACATVKSLPWRTPCKRAGSSLVRKLDARAREPGDVVGELRSPDGFLSENIRTAARRTLHPGGARCLPDHASEVRRSCQGRRGAGDKGLYPAGTRRAAREARA